MANYGAMAGELQDHVYLAAPDAFATKPEISNKLFRQYGNQFLPIIQMLRTMGMEEAITQDDFYHYDEDWYRGMFHSRDSESAGATQSITIDPTLDMDNLLSYYPRVGYTVFYPDEDMTQGYITAIDDTTSPLGVTLTVVQVNSNYPLPALDAGQPLMIGTQATEHGANFPTSSRIDYIKRTFSAQLFKEKVTMDNAILATSRYIERFDDSDQYLGKFVEETMRAQYNLAWSEDNAYMFGRDTDQTIAGVLGESSNKVKFTKGVVPWIRELGYDYPYSGGSGSIFSLGIDPFYDFDTWMTQNGVSTKYNLLIEGSSLFQEIEKGLFTVNKDTGVDFTEFMSDFWPKTKWAKSDTEDSIKDRAFTLGFDRIRISGRNYLRFRYDLWSHPNAYGLTGYKTPYMGVIIPLRNVKDAKTGAMIPNISSCYRAMGKYNRRYIFDTLSGIGSGEGRVVNETDKTNLYLMANHGLRFAKANQCIFINPYNPS